jgi:ABC-type molybdate transport system substrate-binding protein
MTERLAMRALALVIALSAAAGTADATEINAFVSTAIKAATDELLPPFERANGHTIRASYAPSGALLPRFERGEPVDVFLTDARRSTSSSSRARSWAAASTFAAPASASPCARARRSPTCRRPRR